jgi:hypothetical protein
MSIDRSAPKRRLGGDRGRVRGQAIIWLLGTLAACAAIAYAVFNTNQVIIGKQRAVNAADAGALAGAQAQARLLNLIAYSNRAQTANDAFLGQMLGLESWLKYAETAADNTGDVMSALKFIPYVGAIFAAVEKAMKTAEKILDTAVGVTNKAIDGIIVASNVTRGLIAAGQTAVHLGGGVLAQSAAKSVIDANRTNFGGREDKGVKLLDTGVVKEATIGKNLLAWNDYTHQYAGSERTDAKNILSDSRDGWTRDRPGNGWFNWEVSFNGTGFGFEKHGETKLVSFDRWESMDTVEHWSKSPLPKSSRKYQPVGWGRADADEHGKSATLKHWPIKRKAQSYAVNEAEVHKNWHGVAELRDLKNIAKQSAEQRANSGLDFMVAVSRADAHDLTTKTLGMGADVASPAGKVQMNGNAKGGEQAVFSKARVFFERPRRGLTGDHTASPLWRPDMAKEHGSLYSPYWQARLRDLTVEEKGGLMALMGLWPDAVLYTPGGQTKSK